MAIEDSFNYVKYARDVASASWDYKRRLHCLQCSDELQDAIKKFQSSWSREDMVALNGAFTRCYQAVQLITSGGDGSPVGGRMQRPLLQEARSVTG